MVLYQCVDGTILRQITCNGCPAFAFVTAFQHVRFKIVSQDIIERSINYLFIIAIHKDIRNIGIFGHTGESACFGP